MKLSKLLVGALVLFLCLCSYSCIKKGNDDPAISFRTRKQRVIGEWIVTSYYGNSVNQFLPGQGEDYTFDKEGNGTNNMISKSGTTKTDIKWNFLGKDNDYKYQERLIIYPKGSSDGTVWEIRELRHNKIRLKREVFNSSDTISYTMTLEPK